MILDELKNCARYEGMHPRFKAAFDFIKATDFSTLEPGKIVIDGDDLFVNYMVLEGKEVAPFEAHRAYIDIQVPLNMCEEMDWKPVSSCSHVTAEYDAEKDVIFFDEKADARIPVQLGQFAIFFPEDAHAPMIAKGMLSKLIVKIKQ